MVPPPDWLRRRYSSPINKKDAGDGGNDSGDGFQAQAPTTTTTTTTSAEQETRRRAAADENTDMTAESDAPANENPYQDQPAQPPPSPCTPVDVGVSARSMTKTPVPTAESKITSLEGRQSLSPSHEVEHPERQQIPDPLLWQVDSISALLRTSFHLKPPHTIQRLAELILEPKKHYKTLPAWLRAVDRAVSVTSDAQIFPLADSQPIDSTIVDSTIGNNDSDSTDVMRASGDNDESVDDARSQARRQRESREMALGSDESLGGALLTPIPWLKSSGQIILGTRAESGAGSVASTTEDEADVDAQHSDAVAAGSLENSMSSADSLACTLYSDREDGAVTQGELIRMEQEAGIVPVGQTMVGKAGSGSGRSRLLHSGDDDYDDDVGEDDDEEDGDNTKSTVAIDSTDRTELIPHARGPDVVGVEDMGLQGGKDVELQIDGTMSSASSPPPSSSLSSSSSSSTSADPKPRRTDKNMKKVEERGEKSKASGPGKREDDDHNEDDDGRSNISLNKKGSGAQQAGENGSDDDDDGSTVARRPTET